MNKHEARGIFRDLLMPVIILVIFVVLVFIQQKGYQNNEGGNIEELFIDQDAWENLMTMKDGSIGWRNDRKAYLLIDPNDPDSVQTSEQVAFVLASVGVETISKHVYIPDDKIYVRKRVISSEIPADCTDLILCFPSLLSSGIDVPDLTEWISTGGNLILSNGLEADELTDTETAEQNWFPVLGIKTIKTESNVPVDSMIIQTAFLSGAKDMEFSDDVILCDAVDAELQPECLVHVTSADEFHRPLLWERNLGNGRILVCNADLMGDKTSRGAIISCFARMDTAFVYPVINSAVYCIDDFPSASPAGFDDNVLSQYGYTIHDFYANVWWPAMQKIAEEYGIRFSAFLIQCYDADVHGPFTNTDNQPSASYYAKNLLELNCEIGLHGYNHQPLVLEGFEFNEKNDGYTCWVTVEEMLASVKAALTYAEMLDERIDIQAYVAPSNILSPEAMGAMIRQCEELRIFAGVYIGTSDQLIQEFSVLDEDVVQVPRLTADMQMESSEWWLQVNELNYHYYESNYIHPDDILDEERTDGGDFSMMVSSYENMVKWNLQYGLRTATISEAAGAVQRYCNLSVSQTTDQTGMTIHLDGLIDEAFLLLRTREIPETISTGEIREIDEGCYLIRTEEPDIRVEWSRKR